MPDASGLFNMMRNLGGAVGIALIDTVLYGRTGGHIEAIRQRLIAGDVATAQAIGLDRIPADLSAAALIEQAAFAASANEAWALMAAMAVLGLLLIPFARPQRADAAERMRDQFGLIRTPSRPARSCMNCQATRPEREPRVVAHSSASRSSSASGELDAEMAAIALDHREVFVLAAAVEAEPEAEAVGQRDLFLDRFAGIDRGRALVLDHVARHQVPAVRGRVEDHVVRPALDAALQHRLERLVGGVLGVEREVVAEHDEAVSASRAAASIRPGRLSMSSRWISISLSGPACLPAAH